MVTIAKHAALLEKLGLATLAGVKAFRGDPIDGALISESARSNHRDQHAESEFGAPGCRSSAQLIKNHKGRRDIFRIRAVDGDCGERVLFLKRCWKPYKKDGLASVLRRGKVWSVSRQEWENSRALEAAGIRTAGLVAYGEECGPFWEHFSFILTEAAAGSQTVEQFLRSCTEPTRRRRVFDALANEIRRMHDAGLASPDLFTRHLFVDESSGEVRFCLIDMARLDRQRPLTDRMRARDLAALNITAPMRYVSAWERIRFLRVYRGAVDRGLVSLVRNRVEYLLRRRKFRGFAEAEAKRAVTA